MRVSDDGKMAVVDSAIFAGTKDFYATRGVIADANLRLTATGSPYRLRRGDDSIQGRTPWTCCTYLRLYKVVPEDTRGGAPGEKGGSGDNLRTLENCSAHGLDSMGIGATASAQRNSRREFRIYVGDGATVRNVGASGHVDSDLTAKNIILAKIHRDKHGLAAHVAVTRDEASETYANLTDTERRTYARLFRINEFAVPKVGEGIEALRTTSGGRGFPMHFAAVVARSGKDYVTLENWAKSSHTRDWGDTPGASNAWYFRMYGPYKSRSLWWDEDQSYSGEHATEGSIQDRQNIMGLVNRNVAKAPVVAAPVAVPTIARLPVTTT